MGSFLDKVKPVGGRRKVESLKQFAAKYDQPLSGWALIGSSFPDALSLRAVRDAGGLAIAFNADSEALSNSTFALASTSLIDLLDILTGWQKGGNKAVEKRVREKEKAGSKEKGYLTWLAGRTDLSQVLDNHDQIRQLLIEKTNKK